MKTKPTHFLIILWIGVCLPVLPALAISQTSPVADTPSTVPKKLTVSAMQADYDLLRKALEEAHGGLYRFSTKAEMNKRFDTYRKKIERIDNQRAFIALLCEMLATIRDGHMRLEYDPVTITALVQSRLFPFRVSIEDAGLMVLFNDSRGDSSIRPGMEILDINGHKANELLKLMLSCISGDGFIETGKKRRLERGFAAYYWLLVDQSMEFSITARDSTGKVVAVKLPGVLNAERENNRNSNLVNTTARANVSSLDGVKDNISFRFVRDPAIAYLRIRSFDVQDFQAPVDSIFRVLHLQKTKALILDLRGNGGGIDMHGAYLVSQFTNKPFRYFDRIRLKTIQPSFTSFKASTLDDLRNGVVADPNGGYLVTARLHNGVSEQQPAKFPFSGMVYVLLDGGTFSTAADVAAALWNVTTSSFIGEESGGTYEGNASGLNTQVKLPNSQLSLKIHMYEYWNAGQPTEKGAGIRPDHAVEKRVADVLQGIDKPMNRAVELALAKLKN
jgi:hypothetical protein